MIFFFFIFHMIVETTGSNFNKQEDFKKFWFYAFNSLTNYTITDDIANNAFRATFRLRAFLIIIPLFAATCDMSQGITCQLRLRITSGQQVVLKN